MNSVERVKALCKERGIAISRLEKELGFANGYISQLRKGSFPADRLAVIARYLSVSQEYLLSGEEPVPLCSISPFDFRLSDHERDLILAYRARPDMRPAVDRLLGLDEKEKASPAFDAKDA